MSGTADRPGLVARALMGAVTVYRSIPKSPTPRCRFYPSCSQYALVALERHGAWRGGGLAVRRVLRCHPFNEGGIDHVPQRVRRTPDLGSEPREGATA